MSKVLHQSHHAIDGIQTLHGKAAFAVRAEADDPSYSGAVILEQRAEMEGPDASLTIEAARRLANELLVAAGALEAARLEEAGENAEEDVRVFGKEAWVHCDSHGRPHTTGWCTVSPTQKTLLTARAHDAAVEECRRRGLWLYQDKDASVT